MFTHHHTGLTRKDLRALQHADEVIFRWIRTRPYQAEIVCGKAFRRHGFEGRVEHRLVVDVLVPDGLTRCFGVIGAARFDPRWTTLAAHLRPGDRLCLVWQPDGQTDDYLAAAGLHGDVLWLQVTRRAARFEWLIESRIRPANGTRMIQGPSEVLEPYQVVQTA